MAVEVSIHEAKTHLSKLLRRVMSGEEIIIANAGRPVARLTPYEAQVERREPGRYAGRIRIADDFDAPLPEDIAGAFQGDRDADSP